MTVFNREREAINSTCSPRQLADALKSLDLASIPREKRHAAVLHRLAEVISATTTSPAERAKPAFDAIQQTYLRVAREAARPLIIGL